MLEKSILEIDFVEHFAVELVGRGQVVVRGGRGDPEEVLVAPVEAAVPDTVHWAAVVHRDAVFNARIVIGQDLQF